MKYLSTLLFVCCSAFLLSSCDKDFTCRCESGGWGSGPVDVEIQARDEKAAKVECTTLYHGWDDAPSDCHLK